MKVVREGRVISANIQSNSEAIHSYRGPIGVMAGIPTGQFTIKTDSGTEFDINVTGNDDMKVIAAHNARLRVTIESIEPDSNLLRNAANALDIGLTKQALKDIGEVLKRL